MKKFTIRLPRITTRLPMPPATRREPKANAYRRAEERRKTQKMLKEHVP